MKVKGMAVTFDSPNILIPVEIEITDPEMIAMITGGSINEYSISTCDQEDVSNKDKEN